MTKKELREYYWIRKNIAKLENRVLELETIATRQTSQLKHVPVFGLNTGDRVGDTVAEIQKVRDDIQVQLKKSYEVMAKVEKAIEDLPEREKYLIRARYLELSSWEQIAVDMGYSWQHTHKIHSDALKLLA